MLRWIRRNLRRLKRYPRIVNYPVYCRAKHGYPEIQRKIVKNRDELQRLLLRHIRERRLHRQKVAECEDLKHLLGLEAPEVLELWKAEQRARIVTTDKVADMVVTSPKMNV